MASRHIMVATWMGAVAAVIATAIAAIPFVTGKNKLADFFAASRDYRSPPASQTNADNIQNSAAADNSTGTQIRAVEVTLDTLIDLATQNKMAGLQAEQLTKDLDGKTIILSGYLIDSRRNGWASSAEISSSKTGAKTFYLNIDRSDQGNWAIPKGSYLSVRTTLKQPWMGTMVGNNARLLKVEGENKQDDATHQ